MNWDPRGPRDVSYLMRTRVDRVRYLVRGNPEAWCVHWRSIGWATIERCTAVHERLSQSRPSTDRSEANCGQAQGKEWHLNPGPSQRPPNQSEERQERDSSMFTPTPPPTSCYHHPPIITSTVIPCAAASNGCDTSFAWSRLRDCSQTHIEGLCSSCAQRHVGLLKLPWTPRFSHRFAGRPNVCGHPRGRLRR
eukprot:170002-Pyramimonas_sp.AAC.1